MSSEPDEPFFEGPVEMPIDGELDLHTFRPEDIGELVPDYIQACREKGIYKIRIVHGKGTGSLRRGVEAILSKHPDVISFLQASEHFGSWGATIVSLRAKTE
jgi:DNA-nicking Smr family endonuclease